MGSLSGVCPIGFQRSSTFISGCIVECPTDRGFESRTINGESFCVYKDRPEFKLLLKLVPAVSASPNEPRPTLDSLLAAGDFYREYRDAKEDYDKNMPLLLSQITRESELADAFRQLQDAENVRDQSPQAYQDARNRYYTILYGEGWINEEGQRIANAEVNPRITQYTQVKSDLKTRLNQQQQTIDVVNSVKDKVLSMRDDFAYTTNAFAKQISDLKNQINIEKKKTELQKVEISYWVDSILNVLITVLVLGLLYIILRRVVFPSIVPAYTPPRRQV